MSVREFKLQQRDPGVVSRNSYSSSELRESTGPKQPAHLG